MKEKFLGYISQPANKDWVYEVITNTIQFDNLIRVHIFRSLGMNPKIKDKKVINIKEIERFDEMYELLGSSTKLRMLKEWLGEKFNINPRNLLSDFDQLFLDLYNIRNIFAHNIFPKQYSRERHKLMSNPNWEELYKKHKEIYKKLQKWHDDFLKSV